MTSVPVQLTTDTVLVQRLIKHYNPYTPLDITKRKFLSKKWRPRTKYVPDGNDKFREDPNWHCGRIAHFVNMIRKGLPLDQIEVDMRWHLDHCVGISVLDGHHRLCAADIAGLDRIPVSIGGIVDIIEWLAGIHDNAPDF